AGTIGVQHADVILLSVNDSEDLDMYKGRLQGKVVLLPRADSLQPAYEADASRYSDEELKEMANWKPETSQASGSDKVQSSLRNSGKEANTKTGAGEGQHFVRRQWRLSHLTYAR